MKDLFEAALAAYENAHAPYSGFKVGAAVRGADGGVFAGCNVENASYPEGNCAEASALAAMVATGETRLAEALVLAAGERLCTPCGGCRQRLAEFAGPELPIHLCDPAGLRQTVTLGDLLPLSFGLDDTETPAPAATGPLEVIRSRSGGLEPRIGLVLGSGLGGLADAIEQAVVIPYTDLPGFPQPGVQGHAGRLLLGRLEGVPVACLQGRVHLYEGVPATAVIPMIRVLKGAGCERLILTNAAGSLRPEIGPGAIVLIEDHINLQGQNPLTGPNEPVAGPRFVDLSEVYDRRLRERALAQAGELGIPLASGVYLATSGPSFETPAEIRAFRTLGADLVGMSTVAEAISARHCGLEVLGFSVVTNLAAGLGRSPLSHEETLAVAAQGAAALERLLRALLGELKA
jgi:xanthosine phosphorylase